MSVTLPERHIYTFYGKNQNVFPKKCFVFNKKSYLWVAKLGDNFQCEIRISPLESSGTEVCK